MPPPFSSSSTTNESSSYSSLSSSLPSSTPVNVIEFIAVTKAEHARQRKAAHNQVEARRRERINRKIQQLRAVAHTSRQDQKSIFQAAIYELLRLRKLVPEELKYPAVDPATLSESAIEAEINSANNVGKTRTYQAMIQSSSQNENSGKPSEEPPGKKIKLLHTDSSHPPVILTVPAFDSTSRAAADIDSSSLVRLSPLAPASAASSASLSGHPDKEQVSDYGKIEQAGAWASAVPALSSSQGNSNSSSVRSACGFVSSHSFPPSVLSSFSTLIPISSIPSPSISHISICSLASASSLPRLLGDVLCASASSSSSPPCTSSIIVTSPSDGRSPLSSGPQMNPSFAPVPLPYTLAVTLPSLSLPSLSSSPFSAPLSSFPLSAFSSLTVPFVSDFSMPTSSWTKAPCCPLSFTSSAPKLARTSIPYASASISSSTPSFLSLSLSSTLKTFSPILLISSSSAADAHNHAALAVPPLSAVTVDCLGSSPPSPSLCTFSTSVPSSPALSPCSPGETSVASS